MSLPKIITVFDAFVLGASQAQDGVVASRAFSGPPTGEYTAKIAYSISYPEGTALVSGCRATIQINGVDVVDTNVALGQEMAAELPLDIGSLTTSNSLIIFHDNDYLQWSDFIFTIRVVYEEVLQPDPGGEDEPGMPSQDVMLWLAAGGLVAAALVVGMRKKA